MSDEDGLQRRVPLVRLPSGIRGCKQNTRDVSRIARVMIKKNLPASASFSAPNAHSSSYALHMNGSDARASAKCAIAALARPVSLHMTPRR